MGSQMPNDRDCSGLVCGIPSQGIKRTAGSHPGEGMPQTRSNAWQRVSGRGIGYYRYVPEHAAGRRRLFPWDGSLRSALFPRKESPAACLKQWICEVRVSPDRTFHSYSTRIDYAAFQSDHVATGYIQQVCDFSDHVIFVFIEIIVCQSNPPQHFNHRCLFSVTHLVV